MGYCGKNQERYYPFYKFLRTIRGSLDWEYILKNFEVEEVILDEFSDSVDFVAASQYCKLSEAFIYKYANKVDWDRISAFQTLSEEFINKNISKLNLKKIANSNNTLSDTFIYNHADELDWNQVVKCQTFSDTVLYEFKDKIDWKLAFVVQRMVPSFITTLMEAGVLMNWKGISIYQKLDENFIRANINKLDIVEVLKCQTLSDSFREELQTILDNKSEEKDPEPIEPPKEDGEESDTTGSE